ncbi:mavicyanin-like protein [Tanacetum coccineum]|uniref:Mavicyanin-like protein n=1 Tax=Tanacetum coccineum TaxID=301880 RepID=A0ABQ5C7J5_9ASTR
MLKVSMMIRLMLLIMMEGALMKAVMGEVYTVGDSNGWSILANSSYYTWTSGKKFRVGDTLLFHYRPTNHNVVRVNKENFKSCNITAPLKTYETGNDSFTIRGTGHYFFTCSFPGHCDAGQKIDIRVLKTYSQTTNPHTNVNSSTTPAAHVAPNTTAMVPRSVATATNPNCLLMIIVTASIGWVSMWGA